MGFNEIVKICQTDPRKFAKSLVALPFGRIFPVFFFKKYIKIEKNVWVFYSRCAKNKKYWPMGPVENWECRRCFSPPPLLGFRMSLTFSMSLIQLISPKRAGGLRLDQSLLEEQASHLPDDCSTMTNKHRRSTAAEAVKKDSRASAPPQGHEGDINTARRPLLAFFFLNCKRLIR